MSRLAAMMLTLAACAGSTAGAADVTAINVLIEPDSAFVGVARQANARLREEYPAGFAFDASHAPHVTVLQRYVRKAELDKVIATVASVVAASGVPGRALNATGLYASTFAGLGMASIAVGPAPELARLQQDLVAALAPFIVSAGHADAFVGKTINDATIAYVRDFVPKSSGKNYRPHLTVGVGREAAVAKLVKAPFAPMSFTVRAVSVYQLGNYGTARERLWSTAATSP